MSPNNLTQEGEPVKHPLQLHLKLPVIAGESSINNADGKVKVPGDPPLELELDKASTADEDEEDLFCRQHLMRNRKRMSSELKDLYEVLQKLPTLHPPSSSGYGGRNKGKIPTKERTRRWVASTTRNTFTGLTQKHTSPSLAKHLGSGQRPSLDSPLPPVNPLASRDSCASFEEDDSSEDDVLLRKPVRMHYINLYESILPPSIFSSLNKS